MRSQFASGSSTLVPQMVGREGYDRRAYRSSATWTSSSGDLGLLSDTDEIDDRQDFVDEYNRLARKVLPATRLVPFYFQTN